MFKGASFRDEFNREALTPTDAYQLYTTNVTGTGTATIILARTMRLAVSATIGHDVDVRTSGFNMSRVLQGIDTRAQLELDAIFLTLNPQTDIEMFIGLIETSAAITALPTTADHFGIQINQSANANYRFSYGDGAAQTLVDTGVAIVGVDHKINMKWLSNTEVDMELFDGADQDNSLATDSHTALTLANASSLQLHFFMSTEIAGAKSLDIAGWKVQAT